MPNYYYIEIDNLHNNHHNEMLLPYLSDKHKNIHTGDIVLYDGNCYFSKCNKSNPTIIYLCNDNPLFTRRTLTYVSVHRLDCKKILLLTVYGYYNKSLLSVSILPNFSICDKKMRLSELSNIIIQNFVNQNECLEFNKSSSKKFFIDPNDEGYLSEVY